MKNFFSISKIIASSLIVCGCNSGHSGNSLNTLAKSDEAIQAATKNLKTTNTIENAMPGNGFIEIFGMPKQTNCFINARDAENIKISNVAGTVNFDRAIAKEELSSLLNVSAGAEISYSMFSASANASYLKETTDTRYSDNFTYIQTYAGDANYDIPDKYGNELLNNIGRGALTQGKFGQVCGDSFILSSKAGALLTTTVSINFNTAADKTAFDTSFKGGVTGIASITAAFKQAVNNKKVAATLTVRALQNGGDPAKLAQIFGKPLEGKGYAVSTCGPDDLDSCSQIINGIISYAQDEFGKKLDIQNPNTIYYFSPTVAKYSDFGIGFDMNKLTEETKSSIKFLNKQYTHDLENKLYLTKYLLNIAGNPLYQEYISPSLTGDVKLLLNKIEPLLQISSEALDNCYNINANTTCSDFVNRVNVIHKEFEKKGYLKKINALKTVIYQTHENQDMSDVGGDTTSIIYIPISVNNNGVMVDSEFGISPKEARVSGNYIGIKTHNKFPELVYKSSCQLNFDPNLTVIRPDFIINRPPYTESVQAAEAYCSNEIDQSGKRTQIIYILSTALNWAGISGYDIKSGHYIFGNGSRYHGKITLLKAYNSLAYNPV